MARSSILPLLFLLGTALAACSQPAPLRLRVTSVDNAPDDLYAQVPFDLQLLRQIPGPDRPDYWLAALATPLHWNDGRVQRTVTHLVIACRREGGELTPGVRDIPINIAFVTDDSVLRDGKLDFGKCTYVAIGVADDAGTR